MFTWQTEMQQHLSSKGCTALMLPFLGEHRVLVQPCAFCWALPKMLTNNEDIALCLAKHDACHHAEMFLNRSDAFEGLGTAFRLQVLHY